MTRRLKRRAAPPSWPVRRKGSKWLARPAPGPHAQDQALPLILVLRDLRHLARNAREARALIRAKRVLVDGRPARELSMGVGLMDTVSFAAPLDEHFRVLPDHRGRLTLLRIPAAEATAKLGRIRRKTTVHGGRIQVTLHDGRNLLAPPKATWRVGDTLQIQLPSQEVVGHLPLSPGRLAYVSGGSHVGETARIERIEVKNSSQPNRVHFAEGFSTIKEYVFVVGDTAPKLTLTEAV